MKKVSEGGSVNFLCPALRKVLYFWCFLGLCSLDSVCLMFWALSEGGIKSPALILGSHSNAKAFFLFWFALVQSRAMPVYKLSSWRKTDFEIKKFDFSVCLFRMNDGPYGVGCSSAP